MSVAWYFSVNAVPSGPLTWDELRQSAAEGKFGPEDFVWSSGSGSEWRKASTIESLFPKPEPSPPPLPPPGCPADCGFGKELAVANFRL